MSAEIEHLPDPARLAEQNVAIAIERLREDLPRAFILVYESGEGEGEQLSVITHCNLHQAQRLLPFAMEQISHQYAVGIARASVEKTK